MAGGGNNPKPLSNNKPSSSSSSSHHRKSRWESNNKNPPPVDKKLSGPPDPKPPPPPPPPPSNSKSKFSSNPKDNPAPKSAPKPSPSHPKAPSNPDPDPGPSQAPLRFPNELGPPPPPAYGFHMLDRRTIVLADGSVRSYFALPPDYQDFAPQPRPMDPSGRFLPELAGPGLGFDRQFPRGGPMSPEFRDREEAFLRNRNQDYWNSLGPDGGGRTAQAPAPENSHKRKYGDEGERSGREEREANDVFARQRQQLLQYGNVGSNVGSNTYRLDNMGGNMGGRGEDLRAGKYMRGEGGGYENLQGGHRNVGLNLKHNEVDQGALKKAFLHFAKLVNENSGLKKNYLADGKQGPLQCVACRRSSKEFSDMHSLIIHTYNSSDSADLIVDHLGLHKALCVLIGWNYLMPPDNSRAYQSLSPEEAAANQDDLIIWPPIVIIHNTITGKGRDGRMDGLGNKAMDSKLRDIGFNSGKSKSLYGREGHQGVTLVKHADDPSGLKEAIRLADFFAKDNRGRRRWATIQSLTSNKNEENNPNLVKVDKKTGEKERIFYGYLGTVFDLDKVDPETRKKVVIQSVREYKPSQVGPR